MTGELGLDCAGLLKKEEALSELGAIQNQFRDRGNKTIDYRRFSSCRSVSLDLGDLGDHCMG
jgi:hypothetical protein